MEENIDSTENAGSVEAAGSMEDAGSVETAGSMEGAGSVETAGSMEDAGSVETAGSMEGAGSVETAGSMEGAGSLESTGTIDGAWQGTLLTQILSAFGREDVRQDIRSYSPLTLAYIGDGIYELVIRSLVVEKANRPANELHKTTVQYVNAGTQAAMILALAEELTQEETEVYKRGKNAKTYSVAKNASRSDYHKATGFETLMGYLYLTQQTTRMLYLIRRGLELTGIQM